jgi:hypothetical protein
LMQDSINSLASSRERGVVCSRNNFWCRDLSVHKCERRRDQPRSLCLY